MFHIFFHSYTGVFCTKGLGTDISEWSSLVCIYLVDLYPDIWLTLIFHAAFCETKI